MKKVVFSITNVRSKSDRKLSGFGYLAEGNLLCPCISKNNKPFIRIFEDVEKHCRPVNGKKDEFQGYITMYFTEVPVYREKDGSYNRNSRDIILVRITLQNLQRISCTPLLI